MKGSKCPYCSGRFATATISLATLYPELASQWHPIENGMRTPSDVRPHSEYQAWWQCQNDPTHVWKAAVKDRVQGNGCPFCQGRKTTLTTCLQARYPHVAYEWHPTKNGSLTPEHVSPGSHDKVWWRCRHDSTHEWQSNVYNRIKGNGCPFCAGKRATPQTSLQALAPDLVRERNGSLLPAQVVPGSHTKVWWRCLHNPNQVWSAVIKDRVAGKGCPYCAGRKVDSTNALQARYPNLSQQWHPTKNAPLTPADVTSHSNRRVWWCCSDNPTHEWEAVIANRVSGTGCPLCANQQVTPATSLAGHYPHLAAEWHGENNGELTPYDVVPGSGKKVWWRCSNDSTHEWEATITARVRGTGCPLCSGRVSTSVTALGTIHPLLVAEWL